MTARLRILLTLVVVLGAVLGLTLRPGPDAPAPETIETGRSGATDSVRRNATVVGRPRPDARILPALDEFRALTGDPDSTRSTAEFDGSRWRVRAGARALGELSAYPGYEEIRTLLLTAASGAAAPAGFAAAAPLETTRPAAARPDPAGAERRLAEGARHLESLHALDALGAADEAWLAGRRDLATLKLAAQALVLLDLEACDQVGAADPIAARALAVTLAGAMRDSASMANEECMLASLLGYEAEACARAERLPAEDPVRLFVLHEDDALRRFADGSGSVRDRYLYLSRLAERHDLAAWEDWASSRFDKAPLPRTPFLSSAVALGRFESTFGAGAELLASLRDDLHLGGPSLLRRAGFGRGEALEPLIDRFEGILGGMSSTADGPLLGGEVVRAYCRSTFYSALFGMGEHLRQRLSTIEGTTDFAESLGEHEGGPAEQFTRWYRHLAQAKAGASDVRALQRDLETMPDFGEPLLLRTYEQLARRDPIEGMAARAGARRLAQALDTRPEHLWTIASVLQSMVLDLDRAGEVFGAAARGLHPADPVHLAWWYAYNGDRPRLEALMRDPRNDPASRANLVTRFARMDGVAAADIDAEYRALVRESPASYGVIDPLAEHYERTKRWAEERDLVRRWLDRPDHSTAVFDEIRARTRLGRAYEELGRNDLALAAVLPAARSQKFDAMERATIQFEKLGRTREAESLAVFAWRRYPDSGSAMQLCVREFWHAGRYAEAAEVLAKTPFSPASSDWSSSIGPLFAELFASRPTEALEAADTLAARGAELGRHIVELAHAVRWAGNDTLAFELYRRAPVTGMDALYPKIDAYGCLRRARGEASARAWFLPAVAPIDDRRADILSTLAFGAGEGNLVWSLPEPKAQDESAEFFWLMRASSELRWPSGDSDRRRLLRDHYAKAGHGRYANLGRFVMDGGDEARLFAEAPNARREGEVDYYVGLRAQMRGDYREAAKYYARCVATEERLNAEYGWAVSQLLRWSSGGLRLDLQAARDARAKGASAS